MAIRTQRDDRASRAGNNQALFRDVNERVKEINNALDRPLPLGEWLCECANKACTERIALTMEEYEQLREDPVRFAVAPSEEHVFPDVEQVVERNQRFWVVEKSGEAASVAKRLALRTPR